MYHTRRIFVTASIWMNLDLFLFTSDDKRTWFTPSRPISCTACISLRLTNNNYGPAYALARVICSASNSYPGFWGRILLKNPKNTPIRHFSNPFWLKIYECFSVKMFESVRRSYGWSRSRALSNHSTYLVLQQLGTTIARMVKRDTRHSTCIEPKWVDGV